MPPQKVFGIVTEVLGDQLGVSTYKWALCKDLGLDTFNPSDNARCFVITLSGTPGYQNQLAFDLFFTQDENPHIYIRREDNNVWTSWKQVTLT